MNKTFKDQFPQTFYSFLLLLKSKNLRVVSVFKDAADQEASTGDLSEMQIASPLPPDFLSTSYSLIRSPGDLYTHKYEKHDT